MCTTVLADIRENVKDHYGNGNFIVGVEILEENYIKRELRLN